MAGPVGPDQGHSISSPPRVPVAQAKYLAKLGIGPAAKATLRHAYQVQYKGRIFIKGFNEPLPMAPSLRTRMRNAVALTMSVRLANVRILLFTSQAGLRRRVQQYAGQTVSFEATVEDEADGEVAAAMAATTPDLAQAFTTNMNTCGAACTNVPAAAASVPAALEVGTTVQTTLYSNATAGSAMAATFQSDGLKPYLLDEGVPPTTLASMSASASVTLKTAPPTLAPPLVINIPWYSYPLFTIPGTGGDVADGGMYDPGIVVTPLVLRETPSASLLITLDF